MNVRIININNVSYIFPFETRHVNTRNAKRNIKPLLSIENSTSEQSNFNFV